MQKKSRWVNPLGDRPPHARATPPRGVNGRSLVRPECDRLSQLGLTKWHTIRDRARFPIAPGLLSGSPKGYSTVAFPASARPAGRIPGRASLPSRAAGGARPGGLGAGRSGRAGGGLRPVYCPGGLLRPFGRPGRRSASAADLEALAGCWRPPARPGGLPGAKWARSGGLFGRPEGKSLRKPQ